MSRPWLHRIWRRGASGANNRAKLRTRRTHSDILYESNRMQMSTGESRMGVRIPCETLSDKSFSDIC